ncbi:MAG: hypothetical protein ACSLEN_07415 [Candidatus Malihini olakiniferum]
MTELTLSRESWPLREVFTIHAAANGQADVVVASLQADEITGYGECLPYASHDESVESVAEQIASLENNLRNDLDRLTLQSRLPAGTICNARDCALWDLECKLYRQRIWQRLSLPMPHNSGNRLYSVAGYARAYAPGSRETGTPPLAETGR